MTTQRAEVSINDITSEVCDDLSSEPLAPKHVSASEFVDGLDRDAWRLLLVLPRPAGATWDSDVAFGLRRSAVDAFDRRIAGTGLALPGLTLAVITTDEADNADIAPDEEPDEGEGLVPAPGSAP